MKEEVRQFPGYDPVAEVYAEMEEERLAAAMKDVDPFDDPEFNRLLDNSTMATWAVKAYCQRKKYTFDYCHEFSVVDGKCVPLTNYIRNPNAS